MQIMQIKQISNTVNLPCLAGLDRETVPYCTLLHLAVPYCTLVLIDHLSIRGVQYSTLPGVIDR